MRRGAAGRGRCAGVLPGRVRHLPAGTGSRPRTCCSASAPGWTRTSCRRRRTCCRSSCELFERMHANAGNFYQHKLLPFTRYQPDLDALKTGRRQDRPGRRTGLRGVPPRPRRSRSSPTTSAGPCVTFPGGARRLREPPGPVRHLLAARPRGRVRSTSRLNHRPGVGLRGPDAPADAPSTTAPWCRPGRNPVDGRRLSVVLSDPSLDNGVGHPCLSQWCPNPRVLPDPGQFCVPLDRSDTTSSDERRLPWASTGRSAYGRSAGSRRTGSPPRPARSPTPCSASSCAAST